MAAILSRPQCVKKGYVPRYWDSHYEDDISRGIILQRECYRWQLNFDLDNGLLLTEALT